MQKKAKVFGIGFHKTGTTSLAQALYILGYNVTGYFAVHDPNVANNVYDQAFALATRYDAVQDTPWFMLYKELDQWFSGSKFILTVRPSKPWFNSVRKHFKHYKIPAHQWIYGVNRAIGHEKEYIHRFEEHNLAVVDYFKNRPDDLLVMDISAGDGWEKLCNFLKIDIPPFDFPKANVSSDRSEKIINRVFYSIAHAFNIETDSGYLWEVTLAYLRDMLHFHYSLYEGVWSKVNLLSQKQYLTCLPTMTESVHELLLEQVQEEIHWYQQLTGDSDLLPLKTLEKKGMTREELFFLWKQVSFLFRRYTANLINNDFFNRLSCHGEDIRFIFLHISFCGIVRRQKIRQSLELFGVTIDEINVIDFISKQPRKP